MDKHSDFYFGWQLGITYEAAEREGNRLPKMIGLLDEMAQNGMNLLSLMMTSYAYFDPLHDGFCWPVTNKRLECFRDRGCVNADPRTEYVSSVIEEAAKRGIGIQLFTNLAIYNPDRIKESYPNTSLQVRKNGEPFNWLFCPDSEDVWQLENDEVTDLLTRYNHPNIRSISHERLSYSKGSCYCKDTEERFKKDTGESIFDYQDGDPLFDKWKADSILAKHRAFNQNIKSLRPGIEVWLHSSCAPGWGHAPERLRDAGVDCVVPHIAHFPMNRQELGAILDRTAPNDTVLHFCVRNKHLQNYKIWEKTPEIIAQVGEWIGDYRAECNRLKGILFFNENTVPEENRKAVYELVRRLKNS